MSYLYRSQKSQIPLVLNGVEYEILSLDRAVERL